LKIAGICERCQDFEENYPEYDLGEFLSQVALVSDTDNMNQVRKA
jgi:hypothetical protein